MYAMHGNWAQSNRSTGPMMMASPTILLECLYMDKFSLLRSPIYLLQLPESLGARKLGVGGLIQAYRTAAQMALESASIIEKTIEVQFELSFDYPQMDRVMRTIKQKGINLISQKMELKCELIISVRESEADQTAQVFDEMQHVNIKKLV